MRVDPSLVTTVELPEHSADPEPWVPLRPLAFWALLALLSAGGATLVALFAPATHSAPVLQGTVPGQPVEAADLVEALHRLADDNRKLLDRVAGLERQLGEVTGSAPKFVSRAKVAEAQPFPAGPGASQAPPSNEPVSTLRFAAPNSRAPTQTPSSVAKPEGEQGVPRNDFAVDLGSETALDGLRLRWAALTSKHRPLFDGLEPRVGIREGNGGTAELRLIAGPLASAEAAARICAALAGQGTQCQSAIFGGQRLSLR